MDRSLFPEGVEVHQRDLANTEDSKIFHIKKRLVDSACDGIVSGFEVTISGVSTTNVDVAAGTGYTPNGEYIELLTPQANVPLADPTDLAVNFVTATYIELSSQPEAHETENRTENTVVTRSVRIQILSLLEYLSLPLTSEDQSEDTIDRTILLARVVGRGQGVPLIASSITSPETFLDFVTIEQLTVITGVNIVGLSDGTSTTLEANDQAQIQFNPTTNGFAYKAPGDALGGFTGVVGDTVLTIASFNGTDTITLDVTANLLPPDVGAGIISEDLDVTKVYDQVIEDVSVAGVEPEVARFTPEDRLHRNRIGTGLPTQVNPHGISITDIILNVMRLPGSIVLGTGLGANLNQSMVPRIEADYNPNSIYTLMWETLSNGAGIKWRIYSDTFGNLNFTVNCKYIDDGVTPIWTKDVLGIDATKLIVFRDGINLQTRRADTDWGDGAGPTDWEIFPLAASGAAGLGGSISIGGTVNLGTQNLSTTAEADETRVTADYSNVAGAERTLLLTSEGSSTIGVGKIRVYGTAVGPGGVTDELWFTFNAAWSNATNLWARDVAGDATAIRMGPNSQMFNCFVHESTDAATWADTVSNTTWRDRLRLLSSGTLSIDPTDSSGFLNAATIVCDLVLGNTNLLLQANSGAVTIDGTGITYDSGLFNTHDFVGSNIDTDSGIDAVDDITSSAGNIVGLALEPTTAVAVGGDPGRIYNNTIVQARCTAVVDGSVGAGTGATTVSNRININSTATYNVAGTEYVEFTFTNSLGGTNYQILAQLTDNTGVVTLTGTWVIAANKTATTFRVGFTDSSGINANLGTDTMTMDIIVIGNE